jgi:hypothetical protein
MLAIICKSSSASFTVSTGHVCFAKIALQMQKMDSKFEGSCEYVDYTLVKSCKRVILQLVELNVGLTIPYNKD